MQFLLANVFLICFAIIGADMLYLVGFLMWRFHLPPDDNPGILMTGCTLALVATHYIGKLLHKLIARRT